MGSHGGHKDRCHEDSRVTHIPMIVTKMAKKEREKACLIHIRGANLLPLGPVVSGQR